MEYAVDGFLCIFMDAQAIFSLEIIYYQLQTNQEDQDACAALIGN
jgi:hypothetical protein